MTGRLFASYRRRHAAKRLGLAKGETMICDHCGGDLLARGHKPTCPTVTYVGRLGSFAEGVDVEPCDVQPWCDDYLGHPGECRRWWQS